MVVPDAAGDCDVRAAAHVPAAVWEGGKEVVCSGFNESKRFWKGRDDPLCGQARLLKHCTSRGTHSKAARTRPPKRLPVDGERCIDDVCRAFAPPHQRAPRPVVPGGTAGHTQGAYHGRARARRRRRWSARAGARQGAVAAGRLSPKLQLCAPPVAAYAAQSSFASSAAGCARDEVCMHHVVLLLRRAWMSFGCVVCLLHCERAILKLEQRRCACCGAPRLEEFEAPLPTVANRNVQDYRTRVECSRVTSTCARLAATK